MLRCVCLAALGAMMPTLCVADEAPSISKAFGNTIVSTYPDNRQAKLWLAPTGSYTALGPAGDRSRGRWTIKGRKLCFKQAHPAIPPFFRYCTPIPSDVQWTTKAVTGEMLQVHLVEGVAGASP